MNQLKGTIQQVMQILECDYQTHAHDLINITANNVCAYITLTALWLSGVWWLGFPLSHCYK